MLKRGRSRVLLTSSQAVCGVLLLAPALMFFKNYFDSRPAVASNSSGAAGRPTHAVFGNFMLDNLLTEPGAVLAVDAPAPLFFDDFNAERLDASKWHLGANTGNQAAVANGTLELRSQLGPNGYESGWVVTRQAFAPRNTTVTLKVAQPNDDGDLGMSPTYTLSSPFGIYNEANWYRFYTYRNAPNGNYRLYVEWKKNGVREGLDVTGDLTIAGAVYLQLRCDDAKIYFEASLDGVAWTETYSETFALPGYTLDTPFHYELAAYKTAANGVFVADDFAITPIDADSGLVEKIVLQDALQQSSLGKRSGGQFVANGGWQVTGDEDIIVYDLGCYVENGALEINVRNFRPGEQNTAMRHHFLSMFRNPWGNHHPVEYLETVWDMHAGYNYDTGVKLLTMAFDTPEQNTVVFDDWDRSQTYNLKLVWKNRRVLYFRNGVPHASQTHEADMQLRFIFLGRDFTTSADLITDYKHNQYPALVGPIYSDLVVKEYISTGDELPPQIQNPAATDLYTNAARLAWTTDEPTVCYVEYGTTNQYGEKTPVLGPPAQTFSTALANLAPNKTYHYRIVARDDAGNETVSANQTFATAANGLYLFKPIADTYVEQAGLYGTTRDHTNLGWMNLLAGAGRECYWRFEVTGLHGEVKSAALRLHGRQSGNGGGTLRLLTEAWDENAVTWLTKPNVTGKALGKIDNVRAGAWQEVAIDSVIAGNGIYDFALIGTGNATVSWDSRESTNCQPELIIAASEFGEPKLNMMVDDFNIGAINANKWRIGVNPGNQAVASDDALLLRSLGRETGWVITRNAYAARHTAITIKLQQPNEDGDIGMSPTYDLTSAYGIYNQPNWYRFYVYRSARSRPYRLYVEWRKNGAGSGLDVTANLSRQGLAIDGTVYLRLRFDASNIHFEASLDGETWIDTYTETFALPGYSLDSPFYYELAAYNTDSFGTLIVDDFSITRQDQNRFAARADAGQPATATQTPTAFALRNYPNPFTTATRIILSLPRAAEIHLALFDMTGREVKTVMAQSFSAGHYEAVWDGRNRQGEPLRSGIYLLRLRYRAEKSAAWSQVVRRVLMVK